MGLLNRTLPEAELEAYVRSYSGAMIAENAPLTLAAIEGVVADLAKPSPALDSKRCDELVARCFASEDYVEGRRAFHGEAQTRVSGAVAVLVALPRPATRRGPHPLS